MRNACNTTACYTCNSRSEPFRSNKFLKCSFISLQVRKSMCRIKYVMYERARTETDPQKSELLKQFVNNL